MLRLQRLRSIKKISPLLVAPLIWLLGLPIVNAELSDRFPAVLELSELNQESGMLIHGHEKKGKSGLSVSSIGDINGDGFDDVIIGAPAVSAGGLLAGQSYVIFGSSTNLPGQINVSDLNGVNGFKITGESAGDESGFSVSGVGDINGDGFADFLVGAFGADSGAWNNGLTYLIYGAPQWPAEFKLKAINGVNGFTIRGVDHWDLSGFAVSGVGDVNGDGIGDILIGAPEARPNGLASGQSYVVFGSVESPGKILDLNNLQGSNGFAINGVDAWDKSGFSVSGAGDINHDGFDDIVIGAIGADSRRGATGASYVIFGAATWHREFELSALNGNNGFLISGLDKHDLAGYSVAGVGDVNGDGVDDLLVSAKGDTNGKFSGESYVIFGKPGSWNASFDLSLLNGENGFVVDGLQKKDLTGFSVAGAGDLNNDGIADLAIGAIGAGKHSAGRVYVIFGSKEPFPARVDLGALTGENGLVIEGVKKDDLTGFSVAGAGDLNGDGIDDLLIGAIGADAQKKDSGTSYVVFGRGDTLLENIVFHDPRLQQCVALAAFPENLQYADQLTTLHCDAQQDCHPGCITNPDGTTSCIVCGVSCFALSRLNPDGTVESMGFCQSSQGVSDLTGIEQLNRLQLLSLKNNDLTNLEPLSELSELQTLDLSGPDSVSIPCEQLDQLTASLPDTVIVPPPRCQP